MNSEWWRPEGMDLLTLEPPPAGLDAFAEPPSIGDPDEEEEGEASHMATRVRRAIAFIHTNLMEPITLSGLADVACYSPWHFDRMFQGRTGVPPMAYLTLARIASARRQITTTRHSIINVAYDVGYNSVGSFGKRFTALVGCSPTSLRHAADRFDRARFQARAAAAAELCAGYAGRACHGTVAFRGGESGFVFLALQHRGRMTPSPVTCAVARAPGPFAIPLPGSGDFELVAIGFPDGVADTALITQDEAPRARRNLSVMAVAGNARLALPLLLGAPTPDDVPIPPVFPLLLEQRFSEGEVH